LKERSHRICASKRLEASEPEPSSFVLVKD
jgi:hypothetical protein